jgi:hypothetical protein
VVLSAAVAHRVRRTYDRDDDGEDRADLDDSPATHARQLQRSCKGAKSHAQDLSLSRNTPAGGIRMHDQRGA